MWRWAVSTLLCVVVLTKGRKYAECPIGFLNIAGQCQKEKGPEKFEQFYDDCINNVWNSDILNNTTAGWSKYRNLYPGGPFVECSKGSVGPCGKDFYIPKNIVNRSYLNETEELCIEFEPDNPDDTKTAARSVPISCNREKKRYCIVEEYKSLSSSDCSGDYVKVESPRPTCVLRVPNLRATWTQANALCLQRNGTLLQRGWRYGNHPELNYNNNTPLAIILDDADVPIWYNFPDIYTNNYTWAAAIPTGPVEPKEISFAPEVSFPAGSSFVALQNEAWVVVNESFIFHSIICEQPILLEELHMELGNNYRNELILNVSSSLHTKEVECFTDGSDFPEYKDVQLSKKYRNETFTQFKVDTPRDGYYWCIVQNNMRYKSAKTNRILHVDKETDQLHLYALKLVLHAEYKLESLSDLSDRIRKNISTYIYAYSKLMQIYGTSAQVNGSLLRYYEREYEDSSSEDVVDSWRLRRAYLDSKTLLFHLQISRVTFPLPVSTWRNISIIFMKPVYYCPAHNTFPMLTAGKEHALPDCKTYRCVGDYNEGVQWTIIETPGCHASDHEPTETSRAADTSIQLSEDVVYTTSVRTTTTTVPTTTRATDNRDESSTEYVTSPSPPPPETVTTAARPPYPTTPPATPPPTTPPPPEQAVQDLLNDLENLLHEENATITLVQTTNAIEQMDMVLEFAAETEIPGRLLHIIDEVGARMELNGSQSETVVRDNIGLLVADSSPAAPVRGLRIAYSGEDILTEDTFHLISGDVFEDYMEQNASEVVVKLPETLADVQRRVTFVVFRNSNAFSSNAEQPVNSRVLSINITDLTTFDDGEYIDIHLRPLDTDVPRDARRACAYWHFNEDDTGYWSQAGCTFIPSDADSILDVCRCTHLTHFAEILAPRTVFSEANESALEVISITGCFVSIAGLLLIALTAVMFRSWRRDFSNKVWLQLSAAISLLVGAFLVVVFARFDHYTPLCLAAGIVLHYATLSSFCWMSVAAVLSYRRLVLVFAVDGSHKLLKSSAFAWGAPAVVVGILFAVDPSAYSGRFSDVENTTVSFCYPTGISLWVAVYAPIAFALLVNWALFALIVYSVFGSRRVKRHGDTGEALRCVTVSSLLVFLFGLPWIFGLFSTVLAFAYLFALTATFQGFVLFVFFIVGNKKTRDLWLNKLKIRQMQKIPVTSSTYRSRGWRGGGGAGISSSSSGAAAMEEASAKPRSLTARDNVDRFS